MKLSCDVIQDLLPLYYDGVCSEESKRIVEEHIETCADCKDMLRGLREETAPDAVEAAQPLVSIQMKWNAQKRKALLKGAGIVALVFAVLIGSFWGLTRWHGIPIESKNLRVVEVTQVEDGVIHCKLGVWDDMEGFGYFKHTLTEDGKLYLTPMRSIITRAEWWNEVSFYRDANNLWGLVGVEHGSKMVGYYFGTPEDHLVIWEEGMELPEASEKVAEEWFGAEAKLNELMKKLGQNQTDWEDRYEPTSDWETTE